MFFDIGIGIIISIFISWRFGIEPSFSFFLLGVSFAMIPDIDFILHLIKTKFKDTSHEHREILHYPILFFGLGLPLLLFIGVQKEIIWLFVLGVSWHFINDTTTIGYGIQWLWPFSNKYLSMFNFHNTPNKPKLPFRLFNIWSPKEVDDIAKKYGDPDWIKNIYFKFSPLAIVEYSVFFISLVILYLYLFVL